MKIKVQSKINS